MNTPSPANPRSLTIKIIAVGGAGQNLAQHLGDRGLADLPCAILNSGRPPAGPASPFFPLDARRLRELDVADDAKCEAALVEHDAALKAWCAGADVVLVVAGLGGKAGSGLGPAVARVAKRSGALVIGFATLPFDCEGSCRQLQACKGWERFKAAADIVLCLPNQKICRLIDEHTSLLDTFKISNDLLADGVRGVWQLLSRSGPLPVSFEDLTALLRDGHAECLFATAAAAGASRVRDTLEKLLAHPLLDEGRSLANASSVLVSLVAGTDLAMSEVNRLMEQIHQRCDGAQVLTGASVDAALGDTLSVTVITASRQRTSIAPAADAAELGGQLLNGEEAPPTTPRFVSPPPAIPAERLEQLAQKQAGGRRGRKAGLKLRQEQLALEIHSRGRFEKSEPTIRNGEDLDEPTYIRRGQALN